MAGKLLTAALFAATASATSSRSSIFRRQDQSFSPNLGTNSQAQGATEQVTRNSGPNGAESWFNTGIDDNSGWEPPHLPFSSLIHIEKDAFYSGAGSACQQYDSHFEAASSKYNISAAILASIAMQESSCNADADGPTPGLMQVACSNYPGGECQPENVQLNVDMGAKYLRDQLDMFGDNAIKAFGAYNGFFTSEAGMNGGRGLTKDYPCSDEGKGNGAPQNLDYLQETLNGWLLGLNPYGGESWLGQYACAGQCGDGSVC